MNYIEDINSRILNTNMERVLESCQNITPQINQLSVQYSYLDTLRDIRTIIERKYDKIPKDLYHQVYEWVRRENNNPNVKEVNDALIELLDEDAKKYLLSKKKEEMKEYWTNKTIEERLFVESEEWIDVKPRINGVKTGGISFSKLFSMLESGELIELSDDEFLSLTTLLQSDNYFNSFFATDEIKKLREELSKKEYIEKRQKVLEESDNRKRNKIKQSQKANHIVHVNEEFVENILGNMNPNYSMLEKSIYIYTKLCRVLKYDSEYYDNDEISKFESKQNIENVSTNNNDVVCYTFAYIYSDLLKKIGIDDIVESNLSGENFWNSHANIRYLVDGMTIYADSTTSADQGDLTSQKVGLQTNGLFCTQFSDQKHHVFDAAKDRVEKDIEEEYLNEIGSLLPSDESIKNMTLSERICYFNEAIQYDIDEIAMLGFSTILSEKLFQNYNGLDMQLMRKKKGKDTKYEVSLNIYDYYATNKNVTRKTLKYSYDKTKGVIEESNLDDFFKEINEMCKENSIDTSNEENDYPNIFK